MTSSSPLLLLLCLIAVFSYSLQDDACTNKDCGQGKCVTEALLPGLLFHCECQPGWKTIQVGPMTFGPCIIPNCTLDFSCGGKNPPTPPPPAPFNLSSPCNLVWCGDGDCVVNNTKHYCQCHERAANLFHNPEMVCMQQCYIDGGCNHLGLGPPPPPPSSMASPGGGKNGASYSSTTVPAVLVAIFITVFLSRT